VDVELGKRGSPRAQAALDARRVATVDPGMRATLCAAPTDLPVAPIVGWCRLRLLMLWLRSGGSKVMASTVFGGLAGFFTGSISSVFAEPALKRTSPLAVTSKGMGMIAGQTALFATIGGVFAGGTVLSGTVRGKDDMWNQAVGACAAGTVVGARFGSARTAVIACPLFAFTSIMVSPSFPQPLWDSKVRIQ